jgi:hypothetical protein
VAKLAAACESLQQALAELPKPSDFQPLADHLYEFAQYAPALVKALQHLPQLDEALLKMPRPEEYEPLAVPLREFARVSPALVETLSALPRLSGVLSAATERLDGVSARLEGGAVPAPAATPAPSDARGRLEEAMADLSAAHEGLLAALGTLPREEDYAPVARQLRELASVSPSLMEWLKEAPTLRAPLASSLADLREAVERVSSARAAVAAALRTL